MLHFVSNFTPNKHHNGITTKHIIIIIKQQDIMQEMVVDVYVKHGKKNHEDRRVDDVGLFWWGWGEKTIIVG